MRRVAWRVLVLMVAPRSVGFFFVLCATLLGACQQSGAQGSGQPDATAKQDTGGAPDAQPDARVLGQPDARVLGQPDAQQPMLHAIYMAPEGSDANPGTAAEPVATLERVHALIRSRKLDLDVEVRIKPATYTNQRVTWRYVPPAGRSVKFLPWADNPSTAQRPVFDGDGPNGSRHRNFFYLGLTGSTSGSRTNLIFFRLAVQDFSSTGIAFAGNPDNPAGWNGFNRIEDCVFRRVGDIGHPETTGYGAVMLTNSRNNVVTRSTFDRIENGPDTEGLVHGVYLSQHATKNEVSHNTFRLVSGDPIRARNGSNDNLITHNTFSQSGEQALYGDWYCNPNKAQCSRLECPSWNNSFKYNKLLDCDGWGSAVPRLFFFHHGRQCVPSGCPDLFGSGASRLITAGNALPDVDRDGKADCSLAASQPETCP